VDYERDYGGVIRGLRATARAGDGASGPRYGLFATLQGGLQELLDALAQRLDGWAEVSLGCPVTRLAPVRETSGDAEHGAPRGRWSVAWEGASPAEFDAVIVALPARGAVRLLESAVPELARELTTIPFASSAIVVSAHRLAEVADPLDGAGLVIPHAERRRILSVSYASRKFPGRAPDDRVILRTFVGGELQPEMLQHDDAQLQAIVLDELRQLLGVRGTPEVCEVVRYANAMPQFVLGHVDRVSRIEALVQTLPGLELCGNSYHGVGLPDAVRAGELSAERAWRKLNSDANR
jgi:oxygen-dependent protoporphyrinogen oxidase